MHMLGHRKLRTIPTKFNMYTLPQKKHITFLNPFIPTVGQDVKIVTLNVILG